MESHRCLSKVVDGNVLIVVRRRDLAQPSPGIATSPTKGRCLRSAGLATLGTLTVLVHAHPRAVSACSLEPQWQLSGGVKLNLLQKRRLRACVRLKGRRFLEAVVPYDCVRE